MYPVNQCVMIQATVRVKLTARPPRKQEEEGEGEEEQEKRFTLALYQSEYTETAVSALLLAFTWA